MDRFKFPIARDIMSILGGYNVDRMDMTLFSDVYSGFTKLSKSLEEGTSTRDDWMKVASSLAAFFGLPVRNIYRDFTRIYNIANSAPETTSYGISEALKEGFTGKETKKKTERLLHMKTEIQLLSLAL